MWQDVLAAFLAVLVTIGLFLGKSDEKGQAASNVKEEPRKPAHANDTKGSAEAEVITFLARMQEKGRLIDFLMDDISSHPDSAIGAAARVVHQGCSAVVKEHLSISPVASGTEGATISVPPGYNASLYRLTGNLSHLYSLRVGAYRLICKIDGSRYVIIAVPTGITAVEYSRVADEKKKTKTCAHCAEENKSDAKFCANCGNQFSN